MKLCKDCKYYEKSYADEQFSKCSMQQKICPITGKVKPVLRYCAIERSDRFKGTCGPSAKFFRKKEPNLFIRLINKFRKTNAN